MFIDGEHDFASVDQDLRLWAPRVRPGGLASRTSKKSRSHSDRLPETAASVLVAVSVPCVVVVLAAVVLMCVGSHLHVARSADHVVLIINII